jgi:multiple sugar transport system substrate-binding protein
MSFATRARRYAASIVAALTLAVPLGTASAAHAASGRAPTGPQSIRANLTLMIWDANQVPATREALAQFHKIYPNIKVNLIQVPWSEYWTKLQTSMAGGVAPDVFWLNGTNKDTYMAAHQLLDLTPYIKKYHYDMSNYPQLLVQYYSWQGQQYGIPKDFDTIAVFYNKALFQKAHVPLPPSTWTWEQFLQTAIRLTTDAKGLHPNQKGFDPKTVQTWGFALNGGDQTEYFPMMFSNGGSILNAQGTRSLIDSPADVQALNDLLSLQTKYHVAPQFETSTGGYAVAEEMFMAKKVAMVFDGDWMLIPFYQALGKDLGVTSLPVLKRPATVLHGLAYVISAKTKYPQAAWDLVAFLGGKQAALDFAATHTVIPAYQGMTGVWVKAVPASVGTQTFIDELKHAYLWPSSLNEAQWLTPEENDIQLAYLGKISAAQALQEAQSTADSVLASS